MKTAEAELAHASAPVAGSVWHALLWLVAGNAIGVMIAILLLAPNLNPWLGEWTYGRWMMVHMNVLLFGWCSLPMLGFLFHVYAADRGVVAQWCRPVLWLWSTALVIGSASWLSGHSSGKLFLDWTGYARIFFPLAMGALWLLLVLALAREGFQTTPGFGARLAKIGGLLILVVVPFAIYFAADPAMYPAVNPDTGGPVGASQLDSSLSIVLILLLLPFGITQRKAIRSRIIPFVWTVLVLEGIACTFLNRTDVSHRDPMQFLGLGILLVWIPLIPMYYAAFEWIPAARRWRIAMFWWWGGLVITGWLYFLPGILDRFKFTDALVGHSLTAVAGFLTALLILAMIQLLGQTDAWIFNRRWSFHAWNFGVLAYVIFITYAGWMESNNPAFTIAPGPARNALYIIRLITGISMLAASVDWFVASFSLRDISPVANLPFTNTEAA